jgi:DNA-binding CsgD family transcriptional regulator
VALLQALDHKQSLAWACLALGRVVQDQGDLGRAAALYRDSLAFFRDRGDPRGIAEGLARVGQVVAVGQPLAQLPRAARLWGAAAALRERIGAPLPPVDQREHEQVVERARTQLDAATWAAAWAEGRGLPLEQAIAAALEQLPQPESGASDAPSPPATAAFPAGLTAREVEVLRLVAQGRTNAEIAQALILSPYTINAHLRAIFGKLAVPSRSAATRYALEHHLV